ncbi:MAG: helicase C-terminal domain-containing protein [Acidobacteriota bacterium]
MPEVPVVSRVTGRGRAPLREQAAAVFSTDGSLARTLPGFEPRQSQIEMARAAADVFESGGIVLAEAGTGTGKTLAYLAPAILSGQRTLISTGTKNLQEQIYFKDIPALRAALGVPFTATYMKGRANYLCLHRLDQLGDGASGPSVHSVFLPTIREWSARTEIGDRAELEDLPEDLPFWNDISATAETCLGTDCPRYEDCFVTKMRQRAAESDLVIVNHHLLCADASVRQSAYGEVIPACNQAIIDEAHQLEDVVTQYFGFSVSTYRIEDLARDLERLVASGGLEDRKARDEIDRALQGLRNRARDFFMALSSAHRTEGRSRSDDRVRATEATLSDAREAAGRLSGALDLVEAVLSLLKVPRQGAQDSETDSPRTDDAGSLARRAGELRDELRFLMRTGDPDYVYFVEIRGRGVFLRAAPIDVSKIVRTLLLDRMRSTVLTSATLTVDGRFDYIRDRLGIGDAAELRLPSEFDYTRQAILYLPPRMPDPRSADFALAAGREVVQILRRSRGRAFVLFTSYATLREVQAIAEMALDYPIFVQGTVPRSQLLKQFRETPHSVLLATSSFWQGVDVVGDALSCVVIDKIPFASPSDPITAARIDAIRSRGGEPFGEYQVPLAILTLQQGLGRLIRHRSDRGVLAILDPRLRTKAYGRRFVASLPPAPAVDNLASIEAFFDDFR